MFSEGEVSEGGLSENFTTPVLPLTKEELHNEKAAVFFAGLTQKTLGKLMPHMKVSEKKQFLQSYAKWRAASGKVTYNYGKGCGMFGRIWASAGYQNFPRILRNTLANGLYRDIDMANAQPCILLHLCAQKGWECFVLKAYNSKREDHLAKIMDLLKCDRSSAKLEATSIFYGRGKEEVAKLPSFFEMLRQEVEQLREMVWNDPDFNTIRAIVEKMTDKDNKKATLFSYVLGGEERKCLLAMEDALASRDWVMDAYIHDGGLIRPRKGPLVELSADILRHCEQRILQVTGYAMTLAEKPLEPTLEVPAVPELLTDALAARKFLELCKDVVVLDFGHLYAYNKRTGVWRKQDKACSDLHRLVTECGDALNFPTDFSVKSFSGNHTLSCALIAKLPSVMEPNDGFFEARIHSDVGKLLFADGIYDFKTSLLGPFDRNVVFKSRIPYNFADVFAVDNALVDKVDSILFRDAYDNLEIGAIFRHFVMRGVFGDFHMKKWLVVVGPTNCGKGVFTRIAQKALGEACAQPAANNLLKRRDGGEPSKELGWILPCADARLTISQEIRVTKSQPIDGALVKSLSSGGDRITARINYGQDTKIVNKSLLLLMCNEVGEISPADDATSERSVVITPFYSFVDAPKAKHEKPKVPGFLEWEADPNTPLAFLKLMIREHNSWRAASYHEPNIPEIMLQARDDVLAKADIRGSLEVLYEITENPTDFVSFNELEDYLTRELFPDPRDNPKSRIQRELGALGLQSSTKYIGMKKQRVRLGIRRKQ